MAMPTMTSAGTASPMELVYGEPGAGNGLGGITPRSVSCRSRIWQTKIVPHVKITPIAAASRAISNASGARKFNSEPKTYTTDVITMPAQGTPELLILRVNPGACLDIPRLRSTRPVEYNPAFRLDRAAMMSTTWIAVVIQVRPSRSKTVTNG